MRSALEGMAFFVIAVAANSNFIAIATGQPAPQRNAEVRQYLARLTIVLDGSRRLVHSVAAAPSDRALAHFAEPLAEQYVSMMGHMPPPTTLRLAHSHAVLVVENAERAVAAIASSDRRAFRLHQRTMQEELQALEGVLHHLGLSPREVLRPLP